MRTFTKSVFAVAAILLGLASCKKQDPTSLNVEDCKNTTITGVITYNETDDKGALQASYVVVPNTMINIITMVETNEMVDDGTGHMVPKKVASAQQVKTKDGRFTANVPVAPGKSAKVTIKCEFIVNGYYKIGEDSVNGSIEYSGEAESDVAYGKIFVKNFNCGIKGFAEYTKDGLGKSTDGGEE